VYFRLLGPVELIAGDRHISLPKPRSRAVLVTLLLSVNRWVTTDSLVDAIWGEAPPATARNQIQGDISALRRTLRESGLRDCLRTTTAGYQISLSQEELDLSIFEHLRQTAHILSEKDDLAGAAELLRASLELWLGQPLSGVTGAFVDTARAALAEQRVRAVEDWASAELRTGEHRRIMPELTALARQQPLREGIIRPLALALYRDGRTPEALTALRTLRVTLAEELGLDMSPALRDLEVSMLRADPSLNWPPAGGATEPAVNALPASVSAFTGRRTALRELDTAPALTAVTGSGGIGKTALVLHWAHGAAARFPDGLLYVDLAGFSHQPPLSTVEAVSRLLYQLGISPAQIPASEQHATDFYRTCLGGKRVLVVLDNARDSDQARPVLPGGSGCVTVVTSRTRLSGLVARDGAMPVHLDVLTPPEARQLLTALLGPREGPEFDQLAQMCAYVPLALRIAAASMLGRSPQEILAYANAIRSGDRLEALRLHGDDNTAMATTFMHSYDHLEPDTQRFFRLLSLVPGPDFTAETTAALAGIADDQARQQLLRLASVHLVEERLPGRFGFHDLLRYFAASQAAQAETERDRTAALQRLYHHYAGRAAAAAHQLYPQVLRLTAGSSGPSFDSGAQAAAWLDGERLNLVAAITTGCAQGPKQLAWQLADALRGYFFLRMFTVDWQTAAHAALQAAQSEKDTAAQSAALLSLADLSWRRGDYDAADDAYRQAIPLAAQGGWRAGQATALGNLGGLRRMQGRLSEAASLIEESLALNVEIGRTEGQLVNVGNLGIICGELGHWRQGEDYLLRSYLLSKQIGSQSAQAVALSNLVETAMRLGDLGLAEDRLSRALELHRELGDKAGEASTLRTGALIRLERGDLAAAATTAQTAVAIAEESEDHRVLAHCLHAAATICHTAGDADAALDLAERGALLAHEAGHRFVETRVLLGLARIHQSLGQAPKALAQAHQALRLAEECGYLELVAEAKALVS
jgi:DNA-binding SARP family transcriptional activator/tetratricopeptide (TPR) repeat protein